MNKVAQFIKNLREDAQEKLKKGHRTNKKFALFHYWGRLFFFESNKNVTP